MARLVINGLEVWYIRCSVLPSMNVSLYQAGSALNANSRWQEIIAGNLASNGVSGYRKQHALFGVDAANAAGAQFSVPQASVATNFRPGELRQTGEPTDVAIDGPAFFEVQFPSGETAYTRDGQFHIDAQGQLVTKQGFLVLSESGPIQLDTNNPDPLYISVDGEVSHGNDQKGRLRLVEFGNPALLTQISGAYFTANDPGVLSEPSTQSTVRQNWLEMANTNPMTEMVDLLSAMRVFEANQKVIQIQNERLGNSINQLSKP